MRVELASGDAVTAVGTLTLDDDLRAGTFVAFDSAGEPVRGSFTCDGPDAPPVPLAPGHDDGVVDSVSVFVLLRHDRAERLLGLAVAGSEPGADVECPGAIGATSDLLVRVDGGLSVGAITTFELGNGAAPSMRIRAGGAVFEFADASLEVDPSRTSGTFSAVGAGGVAADGAFACS